MSLNREFRAVFQPKQAEHYEGKRRFAVGMGSIHKYIGADNAIKAIDKALNSTTDSIVLKFRSHGSISFYVK